VRGRLLAYPATRYDKLAANYLAFVKLACIRLWLRVYEFTA
jgi:transposase